MLTKNYDMLCVQLCHFTEADHEWLRYKRSTVSAGLRPIDPEKMTLRVDCIKH